MKKPIKTFLTLGIGVHVFLLAGCHHDSITQVIQLGGNSHVEAAHQRAQSPQQTNVIETPAKQLNIAILSNQENEKNTKLIMQFETLMHDRGLRVQNIELTDQTYLSQLTPLIEEEGVNVIVVPNGQCVADLETLIDNHQHVLFVVLDQYLKRDNVISIEFREDSIAYLSGVLAALQTKTNHVLYVSDETEPSHHWYERFQAGVASVKKSVDVQTLFLDETQSTTQCQTSLKLELLSNVDIIVEQLKGETEWIFELLKTTDSKTKVIQTGESTTPYYPEFTLATWEKTIQPMLTTLQTEQLIEGRHYILGLENNGIVLNSNATWISDEVMTQLKQVIDESLAGTLTN